MKQNTYFVYEDLNRNPAFRVVKTPDKKFWIQYYDNGQWLKGKGEKIFPYRLPEWYSDVRRLFYVEGEKDVENLFKLGFIATTNRSGAGNAQPEIIPYFKAKTIYILPDNDDKGQYHKFDVIKKLYGTADKIYFLDLPNLPEKGDISDWIEAQRTTGLSNPQIADALKELCETATLVTDKVMEEIVEPEYLRYKALAYSQQEQATSQEEKKENLPEPENILSQQKLSPVLPYTDDMLPDVFANAVRDISERMSAPADFSAVSYLMEGATILAFRINIKPKAEDDWLVCCNTWGAIVGSPAVKKSPAMEESFKPLDLLQAEAHETYDREKEEFNFTCQAVKAYESGLESQIGSLMKSGKFENQRYTDPTSKQEKARHIYKMIAEAKNSIQEPRLRRYTVQDCSLERLQEIQAENEGFGILKRHDELISFFAKLEAQGYEAARGYYITGWNGFNEGQCDTLKRGSTRVKNHTILIYGGIQPSVMRHQLLGTLTGTRDDGLLQRLGLLVYPDIQKPQFIDRKPDQEARNKVFDTFKYLNSINPEGIGLFKVEKRHESELDRWYVKFDAEAQALFNSWLEQWDIWLYEESLPDYLISHFKKYSKLLPSLALILHFLEGNDDCYISKSILEMALRWIPYLKSHAMRVYGQILNVAETTARLIAERIIKKELDPEFTLRTLKQKGWSGINEDTAEKGLAVLQEAGWGSLQKIDTQGRPSTIFRVNPIVFQKYTKREPSKPSKALEHSETRPFEPFESSLYNNIPKNKPEPQENLFDTSFVDEVN